ncbi:Aste57867_18203 [Aphanomyces stellatus]|uniref:Aste57867_18203 protein n=1 Tax=Aphanomyces stellatus TaxID=120398 RepID=A0A485LAC8_9STRA|nr:hypothetical protein As57867_018141 [Aphanomyces stellatus]VFT94941.1 Aste57867_18203 [Aphanomyces stellatus]
MKRIALVTGGSRGIGFAVAQKLHAEGWLVALTARCQKRASDAAASISPEVIGIAYDASDSNSAVAAIREVGERHGGAITGLVNAAGETHNALLLRLREVDAQRMLQTNLLGPMLMSKATAKGMLQQKQGSIVNIGSVVGSEGNAGQCAYSASKAGLLGLTTSLAKELGPKNIRVNLVEPGFIATEMTATNMTDEARHRTMDQIVLGRFGKPEDVANIVAFLLSDQAAYITGQCLRVDGGLVI